MLGISRTSKSRSNLYWWIFAWLRILEMLVSILSFCYLYTELMDVLVGRKAQMIEKEIPLSFEGRIYWWVGSWVVILEIPITILTFGRLEADWTGWFWTYNN